MIPRRMFQEKRKGIYFKIYGELKFILSEHLDKYFPEDKFYPLMKNDFSIFQYFFFIFCFVFAVV